MKVSVDINSLSCKELVTSTLEKHLELKKKDLGEGGFHDRVSRGMITTVPKIDFNYTKVPSIDNCGAVLVTTGSIAFCNRIIGDFYPNSAGSIEEKFAALPEEVHREIAKEITKLIFSTLENAKSLIVATDSLVYNKTDKTHKVKLFPKKFMYLAAFNPKQWSVSSASAVGNPSHNNSTTIFTLSCRRFVKNNLRTNSIKQDCANSEYFKNVRFD